MALRLMKYAGALVACAVLALVAVPLVGNAATVTSTLTLTGLSGGQTPSDTSFDATSFSFAIDSPTSTSGSGAGAGKAIFGPLVVRHELKPAEALILSTATQGAHLPQAKLVVSIGDEVAVQVTLTDVNIVKAAMSGKAGQPETSLSYRRINMTIKGTTFCWDIASNVGC